MKLFAVTVPGFALLGWLIWILLPLILPFVVLALVAPIVSAGVLVAYLGCLSLYRRWKEYEAGWQRPVVVDQAFAFDADTPTMDYSQDFRDNLIRFAIIANSVGFPIRRMVPKYSSKAAWTVYTAFMTEAEVLFNYKGTKGLGWAQGWTVGKFTTRVRNGDIALPRPEAKPPVIQWITRDYGTQNTERAQRTLVLR